MQIGIQLYTLRSLDEPLVDRIRRVADIGYAGVEFAGFGDASPDQLDDVLTETGIEAAGAHLRIDPIEEEFDGVVADYQTIRCDDLVVPTYDREAFDDSAGASEAGLRMSSLADRLADVEMNLHYHNHTFEFTPLDDGTAFDAFAGAADGVGLEIDTGLANHAGVDPIPLLERYGDRINLVHLTDSEHASDAGDTKHMDLGTGDLDISACVAAAADTNADWIIFEHGLTDDPVASAEHAFETIENLL